MATALHRRRAHAPRRAASRVAEQQEERPLWELALLLYAGIFLLAVLLTTACFVAAHFAA